MKSEILTLSIIEPIKLGFVEEIEEKTLKLGEASEWAVPVIESQYNSIKEVKMIPDPLIAPYLTYQPQTSIVYFNGETVDESLVGPIYKISYTVIYTNDVEIITT